MRVRVLGGFGIDGIAESELGSRKARMLLKVLTLAHGSSMSVDALADVLWVSACRRGRRSRSVSWSPGSMACSGPTGC